MVHYLAIKKTTLTTTHSPQDVGLLFLLKPHNQAKITIIL